MRSRILRHVFHPHVFDPARVSVFPERAAAVDQLEGVGHRAVEKHAIALDSRNGALPVLIFGAGRPAIVVSAVIFS